MPEGKTKGNVTKGNAGEVGAGGQGPLMNADALHAGIALHKAHADDAQGGLTQAHAQYQSALSAAQAAKDIPAITRAVYLIALLSFKNKQPEDAVALLAQAMKLYAPGANNACPPSELPCQIPYALGYITHIVSLSAGADLNAQTTAAYQKSLVLNPHQPQAFCNLGHTFVRMQLLDDALEAYKRATWLDSTCFVAYIGIACTLRARGLMPEALEAMDIALKLVPQLQGSAQTTAQALEAHAAQPPIIFPPQLIVLGETEADPETDPATQVGEQPNTDGEDAYGRYAVSAPERTLPPSAPNKPLLRIIHGMPMSGGALLAKLVGSLPGVALFNNINPRNPFAGQHGPNVLGQAHHWHNLFTANEVKQLGGSHTGFAHALRWIEERAQAKKTTPVIRDWTHLDIFGKPFTPSAADISSGAFTLAAALKNDFELLQIALYQHPLLNWASIAQTGVLQSSITRGDFVEGLGTYVQCVEAGGLPTMQAEALREDPEGTLQTVCAALELEYNPSCLETWKFYPHVDLEPMDDPISIAPISLSSVPADIIERFEADERYWPLMKRMGYAHPIVGMGAA